MTMLSRSSLGLAVVAAVVAMLSAALWHQTPYRSLLAFDLADPALLFSQKDALYNQVELTAPVVSHPFWLTMLRRLLTSSPLGDVLTRRLLDKNGVSRLIELAAAMQAADATDGSAEFVSGKELGLGEPLVRLSQDEYQWHVQQAAQVVDLRPAPPPHRYRTVRDYHAAFVAQQTTPSQVLEKLLDFIQATNATLRCVQEIHAPSARAAATAATQRYQAQTPLSIWDGIPLMMKSEVDMVGFSTTHGQPWAAAGRAATTDDVIAARLRAAGAVLIATTVMHEKGVQPTGYNAHYGGPYNPYDDQRFSGGSSSGSAVAVATGMVPMAVGFDGGGSVRIPAAWSGTVGLAVGYGRIPWYGNRVNMFVVSKAGPLAATVQDAADALLLLGQPLSDAEGKEAHVYHVKYGGNGPPPPHLTPRWHGDYDSNQVVKIGVFRDWVAHRATGTAKGADDSVYQRFQETLQRLTSPSTKTKYKYEIVEFSIPHMREQALAHGVLITSLFSFSMAKELYKETSSLENNNIDLLYQPATQIQIKLGQQISALELLACLRLQAFAVAQWRAVMTQKAHVILTPTIPMTALVRPPHSDVLGFTDSALFVQMMRFIWPGNLAGLPGLAVPVGVDGIGLPVSVQVICKHWQEADCLAVGADIETLFAKERSTPPSEVFFDPLSE